MLNLVARRKLTQVYARLADGPRLDFVDTGKANKRLGGVPPNPPAVRPQPPGRTPPNPLAVELQRA